MKWAKAPTDEGFAQNWRENVPGTPVPQRYIVGPLNKPALMALVSRDEIERDDPRWHISVSRSDRIPSWEELVDAAHQIRPGVVFVVGIPPKSWWMNIHPYCLHLWETRDPALVAQWRSERRGDEAS